MTRSRSARRPMVNGKWSSTTVRRSFPSMTTSLSPSPLLGAFSCPIEVPVVLIQALPSHAAGRNRRGRVVRNIDQLSLLPREFDLGRKRRGDGHSLFDMASIFLLP